MTGQPSAENGFVIVLGHRLQSGRLDAEGQMRCDLGLAVARESGANLIILSGGRMAESEASEARAMREYIGRANHDSIKLILEEDSRDTIGNAYFCSQIARDARLQPPARVVTTCYHVPRARYLFSICMPPNFRLDFSNCVSLASAEEGLEAASLRFAQTLLAGVEPGDLNGVAERLRGDHPQYQNMESMNPGSG